MFDAHIQYFAYNNVEGDDFGVGYLGNKEWWTNIINRWGREDGNRSDFTQDDWDELTVDNFRGITIAEVVHDHEDVLVTWEANNKENTVKIDANGQFSWEENNTRSNSFPRWISRLKNLLNEQKNQ